MILLSVSYNKLWKLLVDKKMSKAYLRRAADISPNTMTKLRRDERSPWTLSKGYASASNAISATCAILFRSGRLSAENI